MHAAANLIQTLINALGLALLIWFGGPLVQIADVRPLSSETARSLFLLAVAATIVLYGPARQWWLRRRNAALVDVLQPAAGSQTLAPRFQKALELLRQGLDRPDGLAILHGWQRRRQLVQLPWFLFIGAPGAGKTTALLNSGLQFPLADKLGTEPIEGISGTRQCDWWFTREAVFIDTAGRYTTQDSDGVADAREWQSFLKLLCKHRPRQPINGVLVTVSVSDLLAGGDELARQYQSVRARLQELRASLSMTLPVYLLVTKVDLLAGFTEFFDALDHQQREQVWGVTLPWSQPPAREEAYSAVDPRLRADLQELVRHIQACTLGRLQEESLPAKRAALYLFGAQLDALMPALLAFASQALSESDRWPHQPLRGVYLSSGTQEGNPIDRIMGAIARRHGIQARVLARPDGRGKAFFLNRLLKDVVIGEADLAGDNLQHKRRQRWIVRGAAAGLAMGLAGLSLAWLVSYANNRHLVLANGHRVQQLVAKVSAIQAPGSMRWLPLYEVLRSLPTHNEPDPLGVGDLRAGSAGASASEAGTGITVSVRGKQTPPAAPWMHGLGLYQGDRLARTAHETYHRLLASTLAPMLAEQLANQLTQIRDDPSRLYRTLRTYLMLTRAQRLERETVRAWAAQNFFTHGDLAPVDAVQREEWLRHVDALLERNAFQDAVRLDDGAVRAARKSLLALPPQQRVLARLLEDASGRHPPQDTDVAAKRPVSARLQPLLGPAFALLFEVRNGGEPRAYQPAVFSRAAFTETILPRVESTIESLADEEDWVLGQERPAQSGGQASGRLDSAERSRLAAETGRLYGEAYAEHWKALLESWQLVRVETADALSRVNVQLIDGDSPLRRILSLAGTEFQLLDGGVDPPGRTANVSNDFAQAADRVVKDRLSAFRAYAQGNGVPFMERSSAAVSRFALATGNSAAAADLIRSLRQEAGMAPEPFANVWTRMAQAVQVAQQSSLRQGFSARLDELSSQCRALANNRFPFAATAVSNDVSLAEFARLFGPGGLFETFYRKDLAPHVDVKSRPWRYRDGEALASDALLRTFERAEDVRRTFFLSDAALPKLQFTLKPVEMDDALEEFSLDIDGQTLRYENGPRVQRSFAWPGPSGNQRVTLRARGLRGEAHEGPWAWLRVLGRQPWTRADQPNDVRLSVALEGHRLTLDLGVPAPGMVGTLAGLSSFRCPEATP